MAIHKAWRDQVRGLRDVDARMVRQYAFRGADLFNLTVAHDNCGVGIMDQSTRIMERVSGETYRLAPQDLRHDCPRNT